MTAHNEKRWYQDRKQLNFDAPIICENQGSIELLMPIINFSNSYDTVGYAWFNIKEGHWNSCHVWDTPEEAIQDRSPRCIVYNAEIDIIRAGVRLD